MTATERVEQLCRQIGGLQPHPDVMEAEWSQWLTGWRGLKHVAHCPQCGGRLVERQGKFGAFWGCDSWPDCKYTCRA